MTGQKGPLTAGPEAPLTDGPSVLQLAELSYKRRSGLPLNELRSMARRIAATS